MGNEKTMVDNESPRKLLQTTVSTETYEQLKKARKAGWVTGRVIDYLVSNFLPDILNGMVNEDENNYDDSISIRAYVNNFLMNDLSICRIADIYVQKIIERVSTKKYMDNVIITGQDIIDAGLAQGYSEDFLLELTNWYVSIPFIEFTIPPNWNLLEPEIEPYIIWRRKN